MNSNGSLHIVYKNELYVDGGCIGKNPSALGGTYAARLLQNDMVIIEKSGVLLPDRMKISPISNNVSEMAALLAGLGLLPKGWIGCVFSDSQITLGRCFEEWRAWKGIPDWMKKEYFRQRERLENWNKIGWMLLQGHPNRKELSSGMGRRGHPVSIHNVWCDNACKAKAIEYLNNGHNLQSTSDN